MIFGRATSRPTLGHARSSRSARSSPSTPATSGTTCSRASSSTARAFGLQAIDGPYAAIRDLEGFRGRRATLAAPRLRRQVGAAPGPDRALQRGLPPPQEEYDRAEALLDAYREATDGDGRGAVMFEGEMIDEASRKMAEQVAARGRAAGLGEEH